MLATLSSLALPDRFSRSHKEKREKAVWQRETTLCRILLLLLRILIKDMGVAPKNFEAYISTCILARALKLLLQALQRYSILFKSS